MKDKIMDENLHEIAEIEKRIEEAGGACFIIEDENTAKKLFSVIRDYPDINKVTIIDTETKFK